MNNQISACYCCGKALSDPISVDLGVGPVCRVKNKMDEFAEKTGNMFSNRSEYDWGITPGGGILYITDQGGLKSVTNDIENVLEDIAQTLSYQELRSMKIMYRDSLGIWDGVRVDLTGDRVKSITFYPITEKNFEKACEKISDLTSKH